MKKLLDWIPFIGIYTFIKNDGGEKPWYGLLWSLYSGFLYGLMVVFTIHYYQAETVNTIPTENPKATQEIKEFSKEGFEKEFYGYSWRYPHIVYAQAILESNDFKSEIFLRNNNMFGMRKAKSRLTTADQSYEGSYAKYISWQQALADRAIYESCYLHKIKTEALYYSYIGKHYASMEDSVYISRLKNVVHKNNLK